MPTLATCPRCGRSGQVPDAIANKSLRCKACGTTFSIAAAEVAHLLSPVSPSLASGRTVPRDLLAFADGRGHPEFPCLSRQYSPGSRVPCADFSPWLCERILEHDSEAIAEFVWRVVQANPGVATGGEDDVFRNHWKENARRVLGYSLERHLKGGMPQALAEARAALVLVLLHDSFGGFVMVSDAPRYLATAMLPYRFQAVSVDHLAGRANAFIRNMRKDTPFWEDVPLFRVEDIRAWQDARDASIEPFCAALRSLPLGCRAHFFDLVDQPTSGAPRARALARTTSYSTRKRGLDAEESARCLIKSGLVERSSDARGFFFGLTNKDLAEILDREGVDYRKSWKKDRLVSSLVEQRPTLAAELAEQVLIGEVAERYAEAAIWAKDEIERTTTFFQLWLGFGVDAGAG